MSANLGDGHGFVNQSAELRMDFGVAVGGTCLETLLGGNHLRFVNAVVILIKDRRS